MFYELLAAQKYEENPIYVFLDRKCLPYGQDWELNFIRGVVYSKVILLLISSKVCFNVVYYYSIEIFIIGYGTHCFACTLLSRWFIDKVYLIEVLSVIVTLLLSIEFALIRNIIDGIPVIPIFLAELDAKEHFVRYSRNITFPDACHARTEKIQNLISKILYVIYYPL